MWPSATQKKIRTPKGYGKKRDHAAQLHTVRIHIKHTISGGKQALFGAKLSTPDMFGCSMLIARVKEESETFLDLVLKLP